MTVLGGPEFSLVQNLTTHSLIHTIRVEYPSDDGVPDFLVDDVIDPDAIPDTIYSSDGRIISPVATVRNVTISGSINSELTIEFLPPTTGYIFMIIDDPAPTSYILNSVQRSDTKNILLGSNAWRTHRIKRIQGQTPFSDNKLYIVDYNSTGRYTLNYSGKRKDSFITHFLSPT